MMSHGNSFFLAPSALFRTEAMKRNGGFSLKCGNSGDVEMWMRILLQGGGIGFIDEPLFKYRITDTQISSKGEAARTTQSEYFEVMYRFVSQIKVSAEVQTAYEGLKQLDLLQAGLNLHQLKSDPELLLKSAKWFGDRQNQSALKNFGLIDRIKVRGVLALSPWLATGAGPWLSRKWSRLTDPRTSLGLKVLMKLKR
jgi:hypothetical protein